MAIALQQPHHRVAPRARWVRQPPTEPSAVLATLMLALLMVGIVTVILSVQAIHTIVPTDLTTLLARTNPTRPADGATPPARPVKAALAQTDQATAAEAAPVAITAPVETTPATDAAAAPAAATPVSTGLAIGQRAHIAHTDGMGVVLHSAPNTNARRPAGLMDGAAVTVLALADGDWVQVRSDSKQTGWVPAAFLVGE
jgi:hypothetical protein